MKDILLEAPRFDADRRCHEAVLETAMEVSSSWAGDAACRSGTVLVAHAHVAGQHFLHVLGRGRQGVLGPNRSAIEGGFIRVSCLLAGCWQGLMMVGERTGFCSCKAQHEDHVAVI